MRPPCVAGQFYEMNKDDLNKQIEKCFSNIKISPNNKILGVISPHAGYMYSGRAQAHSFSVLGNVDTFIVIGINHRGAGSALAIEDFQTPLGIAKIDKDLQEKIHTDTKIPINDQTHMYEHSLEVQMPFLKFTQPNAKVCPIIISEDFNYKEVAQALAQTIRESDKKIQIIASSDFTHYGPNYGYVPFSNEIKQNMYNLDRTAINLINKLDANGFISHIKKTGSTICGRYPIMVLLEIAQIMGFDKGTLLDYYTSADIVRNYTNSVGYASIKIE